MATKKALLAKPAPLECLLLRGILHLGASLNPMSSRHGEQIIDQEALRGGSSASSSHVRDDQHPDLPRARACPVRVSPVDQANRRIVAGRCDDEVVRAGSKQTVFIPATPVLLR